MTDKLPPNWRPLPGDRDRGPRRVGEGLDAVARRLGVPSADALGTVFSSWGEIVGSHIEGHAKPVGLADGVLTVVVDEPGWATQVRFLTSQILRALADAVGDGVVGSIEVRVGRQKGPQNPRS
ncbi:MAG: DciA family protein [Acidimicrobiales bacterium]